MNDQSPNAAFRDSSFLQGANAAWVEQLYGQWANDPAAVDQAWDEYFRSLGDDLSSVTREAQGASWARRDWPPVPADDSTAALTGEWPAAKAEAKGAQDKIAAKAAEKGVSLSDEQLRRAVLDSVRAIMLIRAYRIRGHLFADLDPLGMREMPPLGELDPATYGFTASDLDRPIFIDNVLGLQVA